jgi:CRISPR system Cascade subunit CasC
MADLGIKIGVRTKQLESMMTEACKTLGAPDEAAEKCGQAFAKELADDTLFFFSALEAKAFAEHAKSQEFAADKIKAKEIAKIAKKALTPAQDGLDIALFGRMVAKAAEMNVEAAASFAHAISTHKADNDLDFFTALDDMQKEPGSAHMGSLEFNSATYYRYISLDLGQLYSNLFGDAPNNPEHIKEMQLATEAFTKALYLAIPTARQTTQSGASFWDYAHILIRKGQRLQASFEKPVFAKNEGYLAPSIKELEEFLQKKEQEAGSLFQKQGGIKFGAAEGKSIDDILSYLKEMLLKVAP